jgi:kynurenine formamidase
VNWILAKLGNGVSHKDFPGERGLSLMRYTLTTHTGTHIDAPFHYGDVNSEGLPARTVSELPLDWCYGDGVVLDVRASDDDGPVTKEEIQAALMRIGYQLKPNDIVLLRTGGDAAVGSKKYFMSFRGVTRDATAYIVEQGVRIIGVDSFGFDRPFADMLTDYVKSGDASNLWPAHLYGREREYCQLERLTNLGSISKPYGFTVSCFPVHLKRADAAWCRVVAMEESKESQCSK